jgi:ATP-dependent RNA helicase DHX57
MLREELFHTISEMALLPFEFIPSEPALNINSQTNSLVKAVILAGLWPRVARVHLPQNAIKYDQVQAGTIRRRNEAREYQLYDIGKHGKRVFAHPGSIMFSQMSGKSSFLVYFNKHQTTKIYLRDATEVNSYCVSSLTPLHMASRHRFQYIPSYYLEVPCRLIILVVG